MPGMDGPEQRSPSMSPSRRALIWVALAVGLAGAVAGCSDEPDFNDLMDGILMDPSEYELVQQCVLTDDEFVIEAAITNLTDRERGYRVRYFFTKPDGTESDMFSEGSFAQPGETIDLTLPLIRAEDMTDPEPCGVEIYISAIEGLGQ